MKYFPTLVPFLLSGGLAVPVLSIGTAVGADPAAIDIGNAIFTNRSADCADYAGVYSASVNDVQRTVSFESSVSLTTDEKNCYLQSDSIPNYNFNEPPARFVTPVAEADFSFTLPRAAVAADEPTPLSPRSYDAVLLNGVVIDVLSAGCYNPSASRANQFGNTMAGCSESNTWQLDALWSINNFGTDAHNAHTQPDGTYHYHGNPNALFDTNPGTEGSPVIGFAADGFPIYGSWIPDASSGKLRKAVSGYTLKKGQRPSSETDPGGTYDGMYVQDYEYTSAGDLDQCNGMTVDGQYGYYVTDGYPFLLACFTGTADGSFSKRPNKNHQHNKKKKGGN